MCMTSFARRWVALAQNLGRRELDCIPDRVRDDLPQVERVSSELVGDVRVDVVGQVPGLQRFYLATHL